MNLKITRPQDVANMFMEELKHEKQEKLKLLLLNTKNEVIKNIEIKTGSSSEIIVQPAEILKEVIKEELSKFILIHNHPSGDATPSDADIKFTKKLDESAKLLGVNLLDHIVIGKDCYKSIRKEMRI